jgi:hypothetical protein
VLPCAAAAQRGEASRGGASLFPRDDSAEVLVTRTEVRVRFAPDTDTGWGWPASAASAHPLRYVWSATVEGTEGPRSFDLVVKAKDTLAATFPSLDSLVRAGTSSLCQPGMQVQCFPATVSASVEDRRVVLRYRDDTNIARIFGLRPATAVIMTSTLHGPSLPTLSMAPVRYPEPVLLPLTSARRVEASRARRGYDVSVNRMYRGISGGTTQPLWLEEGDSTQLGIGETHCAEDLCTMYHGPRTAPRTWGSWSSSNTSVARLHPTTGKITDWWLSSDSSRVMTLVALRPGRARVRAAGVHDVADLEPTSISLDSIVTRDVLVTPRVGRFAISPRPTTMHTGERRSLSVLVIDRAGRAIEGAPVELLWGQKNSHESRLATRPVSVAFDKPGRYEIIAVLGSHADTVNVDVTDAPER